MNKTIDQLEIEKFSKIAEEWWNENGKFKPLHKFNPSRLIFIRNQISDHFSCNKNSIQPLKNLKILDVGCGGGLIAEPITRLGAEVTAIDASEKNIKIAQLHAEKSSLKIDYRFADVEDLVKQNEKFDVVLALEVIEHVADVEVFINSCCALVKSEGLVFFATLNRTLKSLLMAKIGAEYLLHWLPIGTHDWRKFLKPSEIDNHASKRNLELKTLRGFSYNLLNDKWSESDDLSVNYCAVYTQSDSKH